MTRITRRLFGKRLEAWQYAGLAGAPDKARVEVGTYRHGLHLEMGDPLAGRYRAILLVRRADAELVIVKDGFHIYAADLRGKGLGLRIFHRQLENAKALGVTRIEAIAGRRDDENGYYTWPRFGFDGPLSKEIKNELPPSLQHLATVLELIECAQGRRWWKEHGCTIAVKFELTDGSRSGEVFQRYLRDRLRGNRQGGRAGSSCQAASGKP